MQLAEFMPYRLAVAAEAVSRSLAAVYAERYGLTRDEWRVIAQLADVRELKATELGERTSLPKMQVSRAATRLEQDGLVVRASDPADRRNLVMRLTQAGRSLYRRLEPLVLERESHLLAALGPAERKAFLQALAKMEASAAALDDPA
jgi:DNA-binding MarR family transcriptional regulator